MDQSRWFSSASVQRGALRRHKASAAARLLTEYRDHVGYCCRIARRAARKPPRAQAAFNISSSSCVQVQVLPLGLPNFRPFMGHAFFFHRGGLHVYPSICANAYAGPRNHSVRIRAQKDVFENLNS